MAGRGRPRKKELDPYRRPDGKLDHNLYYSMRKQQKKAERAQRREQHRGEIYAKGTKTVSIQCPVCLRRSHLYARLLPDGTPVNTGETGVTFVRHGKYTQRRFCGVDQAGDNYHPIAVYYFYPPYGSLEKPDESLTPEGLKGADADVYADFQGILDRARQRFP